MTHTLPRQEGDLLVVPVGARIPKVCLKCGALKEIVRRKQEYGVGTTGQAAGGAGGIAGVILAQALRDVDRVLAVALFGAIIAGVSVVGVLMHRASKKVELSLPLCAGCDGRWAEGLSVRTRVLVGIGAAFVVLMAGYALASTPVMVGGGLLFLVALVVAFAAQIPKRFVAATAVAEESVTLNVGAGIAADVAARALKRAKRVASDAPREDDDDSAGA